MSKGSDSIPIQCYSVISTHLVASYSITCGWILVYSEVFCADKRKHTVACGGLHLTRVLVAISSWAPADLAALQVPLERRWR